MKSQKNAKEQLEVQKEALEEKQIEAKKVRTESTKSSTKQESTKTQVKQSESSSSSTTTASVTQQESTAQKKVQETKNEETRVTKTQEQTSSAAAAVASTERRKSSIKKVEEKKAEEKKTEQEVKKKEQEVKRVEEKKTEVKVAEKKTEKVAEKKVEERKQSAESTSSSAAAASVTSSSVKKASKSESSTQEKKATAESGKKIEEERKQSVDEPEPSLDKKGSLVPQIQVEKEASPAPDGAKKGSIPKVPLLKEPEGGSRRGSFIDGQSPAGSRRGSFLINQDSADKNELGASLKKAPPRRGSDVRRGSTTEDDPAEKPSIPLKPCPGPAPKFIDFGVNQSGTEGKTAAITFSVTGDPVPTFQFFKDDTEIFEGGRYVLVTDGSSNNIVRFCIRKSKVNDEGKYKFIATNVHGSDTAEISLFVGGEEGMDFRAMLRRGKKAGPKKRDDDLDFGNLKGVESERKASIKETKVSR